MQNGELILRDVHVTAAPAWWPPAPGWWWLAVALLALAVFGLWWRHRRRQRQLAWERHFDAIVAAVHGAQAVAAASELLRRASRRARAGTDALEGEDWLRFLDGEEGGHDFSAGVGRILLDGPFRPDVDDGQLQAFVPLARVKFLQLMAGRR
ncbi:hypothetical protein CSC70_05645 [Pseudoxanthomonas kalamensis DSM 18571]|uniref:DUF4381 family protein n=1 Tax=Pseudoxanthomonas kalamensis TaxID=289483 RepID=UPI0013912075|nr:DUF4381 family protein [Pseudoxanthomonas kalamensis]KAF1711391.1 hypothetical protein CSC70_05645 [Pseudoxanthomonas kalamensis DSM 18571]